MTKVYGDEISCKYCNVSIAYMDPGAKYGGDRLCGKCFRDQEKLRDVLQPQFDRLLAMIELKLDLKL